MIKVSIKKVSKEESKDPKIISASSIKQPEKKENSIDIESQSKINPKQKKE